MTSLRIHFAKILDPTPAPISSITANHTRNKLAFFRGTPSNCVEIWDISSSPCLQLCLHDLEELEGKPSVEAIAWGPQNRLFTAGLHGFILEHDLQNGKIINKSAATSGSVWCLAVKNQLLAAGTEDGFINLFDITDRGLNYLRVLDRQEGRVLCIGWSPCGRFIASGSIDSVRLWDVAKGHAVQRLNTGRTKNKETIVWAILVLEDLTVVAGDSRGLISFWDGRIGVLRFKIQSHKADVLALKLSEDANMIYAAGVDPTIVCVARVQESERWIKSHMRNVHVNDVLSLELVGNRLFSGGIDSDLGLSSFPPKLIAKFPNVPMACCVSATNCGLFLIHDVCNLDIWKRGDDESTTKLVQLVSKGRESIISAEISSDGNYFAYSTFNSLSVFQLNEDLDQINKVSISKIPFAKKLNLKSVHLKFYKNQLLLLTPNELHFAVIKDQEVILEDKLELESIEDFGISLISCANSMLAFSQNNRITVIDLKTHKRSHPPISSSLPTTLSLHPTFPYLLSTHGDNFLQLFNYKIGKIIFQQRSEAVNPVIASCWSANTALLIRSDAILLFEESEEPPVKKKHNENYYKIRTSAAKEKHLISLFENKGEFVVLQVESQKLVEQLPPAFSKKRFGV